MSEPNALVATLYERWVAAQQRGEPLTPEQLCRDHPELLDDIRHLLAAWTSVDHPDLGTIPNTTTGVTPVVPVDPVVKAGSSDVPRAKPVRHPSLPGYEFKGELGHGGMGVVYRAVDLRLRREVAIKMMLPRFAADPRARARFLREARAQAKVEHDHVAAIYQVAEHDGLPFLAMPLLKGQTLDAALRKNPQPPLREVVRIARQIAEGLAAAHEQGLVHRDIKPGNVWLEGTKRRVKILDFGLARAADLDAGEEEGDSSDEALSAVGAIVGTPAYMAPEQAWGQVADARADLFSLGVVLYQMATGRLPFRGPNLRATVTLLTTSNPTSPQALIPDLPPALDALILHLLAKEPAERPASAEAVAETLRQIELGVAHSVPVAVVALDSHPDGMTASPWAEIETTEAITTVGSSVRLRPAAKPAMTKRPLLLWSLVGAVVLAGGAVLASKLFTSAEPKGTLVVEADDPAWEVVVKQRGEVVRDRTTERRFTLPPGEYSVEPADRRPGLKVKPERVVLAKDGRETVAIWVDKPKPLRPADLERKAAERLLAHATLKVKLVSPPGAQELVIESAKSLPVVPFIVTEIVLPFGFQVPPGFAAEELLPELVNLQGLTSLLGWQVKFTEADLNRLTTLPAAQTLQRLGGEFELTDRTIQTLKRFKNLTELFGHGREADDDLLVKLAATFPNLTQLDLSGLRKGKVSLRGLKAVAGLPLTELGLGEADCLGPEFFTYLATRDRLRSLKLWSSQVGDSEIAPLVGCKRLEMLWLDSTKVTDAALEALSALRSLKFLGLSGVDTVTDTGIDRFREALPRCEVSRNGDDRDVGQWVLKEGGFIGFNKDTGFLTRDGASGETLPAGSLSLVVIKLTPGHYQSDADMARFKRLMQLRTLVLNASPVTDAALVCLPGLPELHELQLTGSRVTDRGLEVLVGCKKLATLYLDVTAVTDAGLDHLAEIATLSDLRLLGTKVTSAGVERLSGRLPKCRIEWPGGVIPARDPDRAVGNWLISHGARLGISGIGIPYQPEVRTEKELAALQVTIEINLIDMTGAKYPGDAEMERVRQLKFLSTVLMSRTPIGDAGVEHLATLPRLENLYLSKTKVTDAGLRHLAGCKRLRILHLDDDDVTDEGIAHLAGIRTLTILHLVRTGLTDSGLARLGELSALTDLTIGGTKVTEDGVKKLAAKLPRCKIAWAGGTAGPEKP